MQDTLPIERNCMCSIPGINTAFVLVSETWCWGLDMKQYTYIFLFPSVEITFNGKMIVWTCYKWTQSYFLSHSSILVFASCHWSASRLRILIFTIVECDNPIAWLNVMHFPATCNLLLSEKNAKVCLYIIIIPSYHMQLELNILQFFVPSLMGQGYSETIAQHKQMTHYSG